jgi:hypothetical protein
MSNPYGDRRQSDEYPLTEEAVRGYHQGLSGDRNSQIEEWRNGLRSGSHEESVSPGDYEEQKTLSKHHRHRKRVRRGKTFEDESQMEQTFGNLNRGYSPPPQDQRGGGPVTPGVYVTVSPPSKSSGFGLDEESNRMIKSDPLAENTQMQGESTLGLKRPSMHTPRLSKRGSFSNMPKHKIDSREALLKNRKNLDVNKVSTGTNGTPLICPSFIILDFFK